MAHLSRTISQLTTIIPERAEGAYLYGEDGRRYLDFTTGIAVTSTGHCHPKVVTAATEQMAKIIHAQVSIVASRPMLDLVERMGAVLPFGLDSVFLGNTGTEAVEAAVRLARQATGRPNIIAFHGGYHGRTVGGAALTSSGTKVRSGFAPLMGGVHFAPFPNPSRYRLDREACIDFALRELEYTLHMLSSPSETAAFIIEPVQGEGGYLPAEPRFMRSLRDLATKHGILLIHDEVQSGWGRTGQFWAAQHFGTTPDILVMGKGMGSGFPISAMAAPAELMARAWPGSQGGTYSANPVACAAALATLDVMADEGLVENAAARGAELQELLRASFRDRLPNADVRGLGLMVGVEFRHPDGSADGATAARVQREALSEGLLLLTCGPSREVIRFAPPLVVSSDQVVHAMKIWDQSLIAAMS